MHFCCGLHYSGVTLHHQWIKSYPPCERLTRFCSVAGTIGLLLPSLHPHSSLYELHFMWFFFLKRLERRKNSFSISLVLWVWFWTAEHSWTDKTVTSIAPAPSSERCYSARYSVSLGISLMIPSITKYVVGLVLSNTVDRGNCWYRHLCS